MSSNDIPPPDRIADLIANSIAANTRRAYASDLAQFEAWGGSIPAPPVMVATSAAHAGVSTLKIRSQTDHASDAMLARYVRDGELFVGNAAGALL